MEPTQPFGWTVSIDRERPTLMFYQQGGPIKQRLYQFDRNPYLASWKAG